MIIFKNNLCLFPAHGLTVFEYHIPSLTPDYSSLQGQGFFHIHLAIKVPNLYLQSVVVEVKIKWVNF